MRERSQFVVEISWFPRYLHISMTHHLDHFTLPYDSWGGVSKSYALAHSASVHYYFA